MIDDKPSAEVAALLAVMHWTLRDARDINDHEFSANPRGLCAGRGGDGKVCYCTEQEHTAARVIARMADGPELPDFVQTWRGAGEHGFAMVFVDAKSLRKTDLDHETWDDTTDEQRQAAVKCLKWIASAPPREIAQVHAATSVDEQVLAKWQDAHRNPSEHTMWELEGDSERYGALARATITVPSERPTDDVPFDELTVRRAANLADEKGFPALAELLRVSTAHIVKGDDPSAIDGLCGDALAEVEAAPVKRTAPESVPDGPAQSTKERMAIVAAEQGSALRQPQTPTTGIGAVFGKLPGVNTTDHSSTPYSPRDGYTGPSEALVQSDFDGCDLQGTPEYPEEPPALVAGEALRESVYELLNILYLYPNYRVDYRSVRGGILDAIKHLMPEIGESMYAGEKSLSQDASDLLAKHWPEREEE